MRPDEGLWMHASKIWDSLPSQMAIMTSFERGYTVMKSFSNHLSSFVILSCFTAPRRSQTTSHLSVYYLFKNLKTFSTAKRCSKLRGYATFAIRVINKGSEVEEMHITDTGVARYASKNYLLMRHPVNVGSWLI